MPQSPMPSNEPLRILAASANWPGANGYAFVRAFQRKGHSVEVVSSEDYVPDWRHLILRGARRLLMPKIVADYNRDLLQRAAAVKPDLLFVYKGAYVQPETVVAIKAQGAVAINVFPDTGFADHGPYLPKAIGLYDWVFTTKSAGVRDLAENYGFKNATFVAHSFDPEVHCPAELSQKELDTYKCDVSFIGNISNKKCETLKHVARQLPDLKFFIWGAAGWGDVPGLARRFQGRAIWGHDYAKAIQASTINLGLLFEGGPSAPAADQITSRTFHIPACGGFMLHERTEEALAHFADGDESGFFSDPDELVAKIRYYVERPAMCAKIAKAGYRRAHSSGYSVDYRAQGVLDKYQDLTSL